MGKGNPGRQMMVWIMPRDQRHRRKLIRQLPRRRAIRQLRKYQAR